MMQSSEERQRADWPDALNGARDRRGLLQRKVGPHFVIIRGVRSNDATQVRFAEHDAVVDAGALAQLKNFQPCCWRQVREWAKAGVPSSGAPVRRCCNI
jgi:hypothetical protein